MKLARLPNESIESFINRAEIYRRENEASPAYRVGPCFYVGHLLDSAKLTRKDLQGPAQGGVWWRRGR